jgi:ABC-type polysaccharide/polyol phosphate transport system ATPase subunit
MRPEGSVIVDRIWKRFRADRRRQLLRDHVVGIAGRVRGTNRRGWRWALRDISFRVEPGESLALVGPNGSGKSTLLKILARVMYPYAGYVEVAGRVGALIEVRAGIHPDLTGRENAFLYGSLLGLPRRQVAARFDEIVDFAELDDAIDRQVKFYSSGMQMRLGFAVAAFLQPSVLLVDEVLAVGDASFQQKCLDRMGVVLTEGATVVFVSHDLAAVEATCRRGIWLSEGEISCDGPIQEVLGLYRDSVERAAALDFDDDAPVRITKVRVRGVNGGMAQTGAPATVSLDMCTSAAARAMVFMGVSNGTANPIFVTRKDLSISPGESTLSCQLDFLPIPRGTYSLWVAIHGGRERDLMPWRPVVQFDVSGPDLEPAPTAVSRLSPVHVPSRWEVSQR